MGLKRMQELAGIKSNQTAIEWFAETVHKMGYISSTILQQAKEMEKEQIIDAHIHGHNAPSSTLKNFDAKQYYNETFK
jgi:hypothetical protein